MEGFLRGKCIPGDLKVNETNAEYLVRKFSEAEAKISALTAENELARKAVQAFCDVVGDNIEVISEEVGRDGVLVILEAMKATGNMPATDAFLAEVRASARNEGINFAASRLAAAFNHGHVDKSMAEVGDVVRMILTAKEDLANDPALPEDGLSGEYAEKSLAEWDAALREGAK
ncbi:hypothetical protein PX471_004109 [Salmonella enterica subsp. enterica]|nr:hypothetical protein [Salmonella enterica subsp. enterica]